MVAIASEGGSSGPSKRPRSSSRTPDGLTRQIKYRIGDTKHLEFRRDEGMTHDLENIGASDLVFVTVEFVQNENKPLSLE
jgi:hypothetical protein